MEQGARAETNTHFGDYIFQVLIALVLVPITSRRSGCVNEVIWSIFVLQVFMYAVWHFYPPKTKTADSLKVASFVAMAIAFVGDSLWVRERALVLVSESQAVHLRVAANSHQFGNSAFLQAAFEMQEKPAQPRAVMTLRGPGLYVGCKCLILVINGERYVVDSQENVKNYRRQEKEVELEIDVDLLANSLYTDEPNRLALYKKPGIQSEFDDFVVGRLEIRYQPLESLV